MPELKKIKCNNCKKALFFYANIPEGIVSMDCRDSQCRHRNIFQFVGGEVIFIENKICKQHGKRKCEPCTYSEVEQLAARRAHNPKVIRAIRIGATT